MENNTISLQIVNPKAAGIDVGSRMHVVAVDQNVDNVRSYGVYTKDHLDMIEYLRHHEISTVAMESTGSYWQTLFSALQNSGFEVILVSGSQTKNVKGKKTDVIDAIWIQKLHSLGLLSGSFLSNAIMQELKTYYNHRHHLIEQIARYTLKMQKSLRLMNVRLDVALRDITGKSGMNIIEAILAGQRNPLYLSTLVDIRTKKTKEEIANSLHGTWRPELLFELKACLDLYHHFNKALTECDEIIEKLLVEYTPERTITEEQEKLFRSYNRKKSKNAPAFNIARISYQFFRTDLFAISGVSHNTVLCLMTNLGDDIYKFPTAKSFASWLRLVPNNKISGGRILSSKVKKGKNTITTALRHVANSIGNQKDHDLLPFFKRIAFRKGRVAAITATARKIAIILWNMIVRAEHYSTQRIMADKEKFREKRLKQVQKNIHNLKLSQDELNQLMQRCLLQV